MKCCYIVLLFTLLSSNFVFGADWFVNDADTAGDTFTSAAGSAGGTGTAASPFLTFGAALSAAAAGDIIYVDAGTYNTAIFHNINKANLSIIGAGTDRTLFDNESASANTNYFGLITANGVSISDVRFSRYNNASNSLGQKILGVDGATGITLTNLQLDNSSPAGGGAALIIAGGASVTISGGSYTCNADSRNTTNFNGAIGVQGGSTLMISDALIHNNGSTQRGAGISIEDGGTLTVTDCTFTENVGGYGAAICAQGLTSNTCFLTVSGCWFEDNSANTGSSVVSGGAIGIGESVDATISNCMFLNNSAPGGSGSSDGGAIAVEDAINATEAGNTTISITTCTFDGNTAANDGKAIYADESGDQATILIDNCTFVNQSTNYAIAQRTAGEAEFTIQDSGSPTTESTALSPGPGFVNMNSPSSVTNAGKIVAEGACPVLGQDLSMLPVTFVLLEARPHEHYIALFWQTDTENNNEGFYVEQSNDAKNWTSLGFVAGQGTTNSLESYGFTDRRPASGINYYRLKQVDFDGRFAYSPITSANFTGESGSVATVYPNPTTDVLNLSFSNALSSEGQLTIYRWDGHAVRSEKLSADSGSNFHSITVSDLQAGLYFIQLVVGQQLIISEKFVKK